ncbi:ABC transporter permease [Tatumella terrea]|uniref:ABC transporter permease n=1 Tax=Tatumella terrea TaxID=419007 RepID=A0ABW1VYS7_9GAMM
MSQITLRKSILPRQKSHYNGWPWLLPLLLLLLWYTASREQWMPIQILPEPFDVANTAFSLINNNLFSQWGFSLQYLAMGLFAGTVAGTLLGALFGLVPATAQRGEPLFYTLAQIPTLAWIPLFMVVFGIGDGLKLAVIIKTTLIPVTINTRQAVSSVPLTLSEVAKVMRFTRWQKLRWVVIPSALPDWFTGLRLALSQAWVSLIVVELLASSKGIGYLMVWGRQMFQMDIVFVTIFVIGLSGMLMEWATTRAYRRLVFWPLPSVGHRAQITTSGWRALQLPVLLLFIWQFGSQWGWLDNTLFSSPFAVVLRFISGITNGEFEAAMFASLKRAIIGGFAGITAGLFFGLLFALKKRTGEIFTPTLNVLRHIALFAWLPLLTAWVGNGDEGKIVFIALASFFPMFFNTHQSVTHRNPQLDEVARVLGISGQLRLRRLIIPGAAAGIFSGLRLALIYAWLGNIGAEYFMSSGTGIGSLMFNAQQLLDMPTIICGMVLTGMTGALLDKAGRLLELRATRWRNKD